MHMCVCMYVHYVRVLPTTGYWNSKTSPHQKPFFLLLPLCCFSNFGSLSAASKGCYVSAVLKTLTDVTIAPVNSSPPAYSPEILMSFSLRVAFSSVEPTVRV